MYEQAMPAQLTPAQTENVAQMQTMSNYELQTLLSEGGVPASVAYNSRLTQADRVRIAILYDINVPTLPPSLAPTSGGDGGGGGGGGGQTGSGASSGDGADDGNSNATMIGVVVAVTIFIIVVIIAAALCEFRRWAGWVGARPPLRHPLLPMLAPVFCVPKSHPRLSFPLPAGTLAPTRSQFQANPGGPGPIAEL